MTGKIVQVVGPVVDIKFPPNGLPAIYNAIHIDGVVGDGIKIHLTTEVMQHIGDDVVRTVAMSSTDGLVRGMDAVDTGARSRSLSALAPWAVSSTSSARPSTTIPPPLKQPIIGRSIVLLRHLRNSPRRRKCSKPVSRSST